MLLLFKRIFRLSVLCLLAFATSFLLIFIFSPTKELRNILNEIDSNNEISLKNLPAHFVVALVTAEDDKFYAHHGIDLKEIGVVLYGWLFEGKKLRGASTITQQLVKNIFLNQERSLTRKILEIILALRIDFEYTKEEILLAYLHVAEYGPEINGLRTAAAFYFEKQIAELSLIESVFLTSMLPFPGVLAQQNRCSDYNEFLLNLWHKIGVRTLVAMDSPLFKRPAPNAADLARLLYGRSIGDVRIELSLNLTTSLGELYLKKHHILNFHLTRLSHQFSAAALELPCMNSAISLMRALSD